MQGYSAESKFLVTQCPLVETVVDFWTMVYDHGSKIVVMLDLANKVNSTPYQNQYHIKTANLYTDICRDQPTSFYHILQT